MARRSRSLAAVMIVAAFGLVSVASMAMATEISATEYKAQVEPICKTDTQANEKILDGARQEVKEGKLSLAGSKFIKAASALQKAYTQLLAVPQPAADTAKLAKWLSYVKTEASLFQSAGKALKAGNKNKAQSLVVKLTHNANLANATVISFGFRYCKLQPSKFT